MTIVYENSREIDFTRDATTVKRVLRVTPYVAGVALAQTMLGGFVRRGARLIFVPPAPDPVLPFCRVTGVKVSGFGAFGSVAPVGIAILGAKNGYDDAILDVTYSTAEPVDEEDSADPNKDETELFKQQWDFGSQNLTLPLSYFRYANSLDVNPMATNVNVFKTIPRIDYSLTRMFASNLPQTAMTRLMGTVNKFATRLSGVLWEPEMLRYDGANVTQKVTHRGFKFYETTHRFAINPIFDLCATTAEVVSVLNPNTISTPSTTEMKYVGWNRIFRTERGYWDTLTHFDDSEKRIYRYDTDAYTYRGVSGFKALFSRKAV